MKRQLQQLCAGYLILVLAFFPLLHVSAEDTTSATSTPAVSESSDTATSTGTVIDTGDATGTTEIENNINNNELDDTDTSTSTTPISNDSATQQTTSTPPIETNTTTDAVFESTDTENSTSTPTTTSSGCTSGCGGGGATVHVEDDSDAEVGNNVTIDGNTGNNEAENNNNVEVDTGDVNILAQIINFINTNIIGAGFKAIINIGQDFEGDLDLSDPNSEYFTQDLDLTTNNSASATNALTINANSGNNSASSTGGDINISTGDINISTNVVNVVNSNIINSQFMVTVINIWNNWAGDIVLPSQRLDITLSELPATQNVNTVENNNDATVVNDINTNASSGDNESETSGDNEIKTGNVTVNNQITNQVNTNLINELWLDATVNIFGEWFGYILGLDQLAEYNETNYQVNIGISNANDALPNNGNYMSITNNNDATVVNDIDIDASSGDNSVSNTNGTVEISTGDIKSLTNVFNIVNANIVGGQWVLALVNVFGEWNGDLAFGRPDLKITETIGEVPDVVVDGDMIDITFEYENNGDSEAVDVVIVDDFNDEYLYVARRGGGQLLGDGLIQWKIPSVQPGEKGTITYSVAIDNDMPHREMHMENEVVISSYDKDRNYHDNTSGGTFKVTRLHNTVPVLSPGLIPYKNYPTYSFQPAFTIDKVHHLASAIATVGEEINYTIEFTNSGSGIAYDTLVIDDLIDPNNKNINSQGWALGEVYVGETIIIDYTVTLGKDAPPGTYTNYAQVLSYHESGAEIVSEIVEATIFFENPYYVAAEEESIETLEETVEEVDTTAYEEEVATNADVSLKTKNIRSIIPEELDIVKPPYPALLASPANAADDPRVLGINSDELTIGKYTFPWVYLLVLVAVLSAAAFTFSYITIKKPF